MYYKSSGGKTSFNSHLLHTRELILKALIQIRQVIYIYIYIYRGGVIIGIILFLVSCDKLHVVLSV